MNFILALLPMRRCDVIERLADPATVVIVEQMIETLIAEGRITEREGVLKIADHP